jgi:hypothetical protein
MRRYRSFVSLAETHKNTPRDKIADDIEGKEAQHTANHALFGQLGNGVALVEVLGKAWVEAGRVSSVLIVSVACTVRDE